MEMLAHRHLLECISGELSRQERLRTLFGESQHEFQLILQFVVIRGIWIAQCFPFFHLGDMSCNTIWYEKTTRAYC